MGYVDDGLAKAIADGNTAAEVRAMDHAGMKTLCGLTAPNSGNSPPKFFYRSVRSRVAALVEDEVPAFRKERRRIRLQRAIDEEFAGALAHDGTPIVFLVVNNSGKNFRLVRQ